MSDLEMSIDTRERLVERGLLTQEDIDMNPTNDKVRYHRTGFSVRLGRRKLRVHTSFSAWTWGQRKRMIWLAVFTNRARRQWEYQW